MLKKLSLIISIAVLFISCCVPFAYADDSDNDLTPLNEIVVDNEILPDITEIVTNQPYYFIVKSASNINLYVAYGAIRYRFAESNNKLYLYCHSTENDTNSTAYYIQFLYDGDNWVRQPKIVGSINLSYGTLLFSSVDLYYNETLYFAKNLEDFEFINIVYPTESEDITFDFDNTETAHKVSNFIDFFVTWFRFILVFIVIFIVYKWLNWFI